MSHEPSFRSTTELSTRPALKLLILEDRPHDAELMADVLKRAGFSLDWTRVDSCSGFLKALKDGPDLILADYNLPQFDAAQALEHLNWLKIDTPLILVSGAIGEETAVDMIKRGAADYLLKDRLERLGIAVQQALEVQKLRRKQAQAEALRRQTYLELRERVKELETLHRVSELLADDRRPAEVLYQEFVDIIPAGWRFPEAIGVRLTIGSKSFQTADFRETYWSLSVDFPAPELEVGRLEVVYCKRPDDPASPFLPEERNLVSTLADMLRGCLDRRSLLDLLTRDALVLANIQDAVIVTDALGNVVFWNDAATRTFGWTASEMVGHPYSERFVEGDHEAANKQLEQVLLGQEWSGEREERIKDGTSIWTDSRITPIRTPSGDVSGLLEITRDVTRRRSAEQTLQGSEQRYRDLVETSHDLIWTLDTIGRITFVNNACVTVLGYEPSEIIGMLFLDLIPDAERSQVEAKFAHDIRTVGAFHHELNRLVHKNGSHVLVSSNSQITCDPDGNISGIAGISRDLTQIEYARESIYERDLLLSNAEQIGSMGSWTMELGSSFVHCSQQMLQILGRDTTGFDGRLESFLGVIHPDDRARIEVRIKRGQSVYSSWNDSYRVCRPDGELRMLQERGETIYDSGGKAIRHSSMVLDITDAHLAQSRLTQSVAQLEFVAAVARAFTEHASLTEALRRCAQAAVQHLHVVGALIWTISPQGEALNLQAISVDDAGVDRKEIQTNLNWSGIDRIAKSQMAFYTNDAESEPRIAAPDWLRNCRLKAFAGFPLLVDGRCHGVVAVLSQTELATEVLDSLQTVANGIAQNIDRKLADANLRTLNDELESRVQLRTRQLVESGRRHQTLLANLQGMAYRATCTEHWRMEFVSEGCRELLGVSPGQLTAGSPRYDQLIHPADRGLVLETWENTLRNRNAIQQEYRVVLPSGRTRWVLEQARGVCSSGGTLEAVEGFISEITARKLNEARERDQSDIFALLASGATLELVMERIVYSVETDYPVAFGWITLTEDRAQCLRLATSGNLPGVSGDSRQSIPIGPEAGPCGQAAHRKSLVVTHDPRQFQQSPLAPILGDGLELGAWWAKPILSAAGEVLGTLALFHAENRAPGTDDLERMDWAAELARLAVEYTRAKQALIGSELFNRVTLDAVSAHIAVLDEQGTIVATNRAWKEFAEAGGISWTNVSEGVNYLDVCQTAAAAGDKLADEASQAIRQILDSSRASWTCEYSCDTPDEALWFLARATPLPVHGKMHVLVAHENITDMKRTEEQLRAAIARAEQANDAKSEFLATMSHELRTPLNGILGMNDLLLGTPLNDTQKKYVRASKSSGKVLMQLINDILDLSKIEAGKMELDLRRCQVASLIRDTATSTASMIEEKGLRLECRVAEELRTPVLLDDNRVRQILINLIGNALKFTSQGTITISAERTRLNHQTAWIRIQVSDTGIGIPIQRRDRLFKAFSQVDSSTTRQFGGTGLGLSICMQLVELMGGEMGVESQLGVGSKFWFEIPAKVVGNAAEKSIPTTGSKVSTKGKVQESLPAAPSFSAHVLVAEDNKINQLYIVELLKYFGCSSDLVENGVEVLAALRSSSYDLVLMDCQMPEMDGLDAARRIRSDGATARNGDPLPIIALTANALQGDREKCLEAGMDEYLSKPIDSEKLRRMLTRFVAETSRAPA